MNLDFNRFSSYNIAYKLHLALIGSAQGQQGYVYNNNKRKKNHLFLLNITARISQYKSNRFNHFFLQQHLYIFIVMSILKQVQ